MIPGKSISYFVIKSSTSLSKLRDPTTKNRFVISVLSFRALDIVPYVQDPTTGVVYFNVRGAEASPSPTQHNTYSGQPLTYNTSNRSPPTRSLHTRGRSPSPRRSVRPQSIRKQRHRRNNHGQFRQQIDYNGGSAYYVGKTYQGVEWSQRRRYSILWGILLLILLAALAAGIYFLVKYTDAQRALSAPEVRNPGGYYVNGLYIITSTVAPPESWGIIGHDRRCNPFNNNTKWSVLSPNCSDLTTTVMPINRITTTTYPGAITLGKSSFLAYGMLAFLQPIIVCLICEI
ncbi:hypothetical protein LSH36_616g03034 [Paralvinella palmiformis]|uniref:Uncharacterized protein n=1 Tax=Paralvinella palmiformis TaxID=53620 RepID=A0AAD9MUJ4_9ANNE|nr:hypothetical protein LSH36_616g03034 [Paralvinella palmiformis]